MSQTVQPEQLMRLPGVLGFVECTEEGLIIHSQGDEAELLGNILPHFLQMGQLIGECLGLEHLHEGHILGRSLTAIAIPGEHSRFGLLLNARMRPNELQPLLEQLKA